MPHEPPQELAIGIPFMPVAFLPGEPSRRLPWTPIVRVESRGLIQARRIQKTESAGIAPKANKSRQTRSSDILVYSKKIAKAGPTMSPRPCMEKTSETMRPRFH
jgi:hypothetical protein